MKQEVEETPEWVQYVIYIVLGILIMIFVTFYIKSKEQKYNECIKNVPAESWLEEDIANEISPLSFDILDIQDNGKGTAVVTIKTKSDYKDRYFYLWYEVKQDKLLKSFWKLKRISWTL